MGEGIINKFIITGTGRCGTTYAQAILRVCGVRCGHQSVFNHKGALNKSWDWGDFEGDSSFMAVPILGSIKHKEPNIKIILLVRGVEMVTQSWLKLGLFGDDMRDKYPEFYEVLRHYFPNVMTAQYPYMRAAIYWEEWNNKALNYCDMAINIDFLTECPEVLFQALGCLDKLDKVLVGSVSKNINSYKDKNRNA